MFKFLSFLSDFLFPRRCPLCDRPLSKEEGLVCPSCKSLLSPLPPPYCTKCGRSLPNTNENYCEICKKHHFSFDRGFSLWEYNRAVRKSLHYFKYKGRKEYAKFYAKELFLSFPFLFDKLRIKALIPVPIHKKRYEERGYNQALALAEELSLLSGLPVLSEFLIRTKNTLPQNKLSESERKKNLEAAFSINTSSPHYFSPIEAVLLIDDIYTTGSTADTCSLLLKEAGILHVYVLCLSSSHS